MRRILFVDDDPDVLDGLRDSLRAQRRQWQMVFACGGPAALAQLASSGPFDIVVSDMRMPEMDGAEFLTHVKHINPRATRIVLSGQAEQELLHRAMTVAHRYLSKPLPAGMLRQVLEEACALRELLPVPGLQERIGNLDTSATCPPAHWELLRTLAAPGVGLVELARVMERNRALESRTLHAASLPLFGSSQRIGTLDGAIELLGIRLVRCIALATHAYSSGLLASPIPGFAPDELHFEALTVAAIASLLVPHSKITSDVLTSAVLRNVGQMVLALSARVQFEQAVALHLATKCALQSVEREVLGAAHAQAGAFLLGSWGLPDAIVQAVARHLDPPVSGDLTSVTHVVQVAAALAAERSHPQQRREGDGGSCHSAIEELGTPLEVQRWRELAASIRGWNALCKASS